MKKREKIIIAISAVVIVFAVVITVLVSKSNRQDTKDNKASVSVTDFEKNNDVNDTTTDSVIDELCEATSMSVVENTVEKTNEDTKQPITETKTSKSSGTKKQTTIATTAVRTTTAVVTEANVTQKNIPFGSNKDINPEEYKNKANNYLKSLSGVHVCSKLRKDNSCWVVTVNTFNNENAFDDIIECIQIEYEENVKAKVIEQSDSFGMYINYETRTREDLGPDVYYYTFYVFYMPNCC